MDLKETCEGCKWLEDNNTWCDMNRSGTHSYDKRCPRYDSSIRKFEPEQFYKMCKDFIRMYEDFKNNTSYMKKQKEKFNITESEFLSFVLNDIKRELKYYENYNLYDDLNRG